MSNKPKINSTSDPTSYQNGYVDGRDSEHRLEEERYIARENNRDANGLLMGIALATLAGLTIGTLYFLTQRNEPAVRTEPSTTIVPVPVPNNSSQPQSTKKETTIIERTVDRTKQIVPVPVKPSAAPTAPNININVPSQKQQAPDVQPSPSDSTTQGADSDSSNTDK